MKYRRIVERLFEGSKVPCSITKGKRHLHVRVDGRLVAILPYGTGNDADRALKNVKAHVRRSIRLAEGAQS